MLGQTRYLKILKHKQAQNAQDNALKGNILSNIIYSNIMKQFKAYF